MRKLLSIFFLILLYSCSKKNDDFYTLSPSNESSVNQQSSYRISTIAQYRGLYVDGMDYIVGDTSKENKLLRYCVKYNFNAISLYDNRQIFINNWNTKLSKFIKKSKQSPYNIVSVASIRNYYSEFSPYKTDYSTVYFNNNRTDTLSKFNAYNLESEWWNEPDENLAFTNYTKTLKYMYSKSRLKIPIVKSELYIGWLTPNKRVYQAGILIDNTDRILVHDYELTPNYLYLKTRLDTLGYVAKSKNKIIQVIIIFSSESTNNNSFHNNFMGDYYLTHTFQNSYDDIVNQYMLSTTYSKYGAYVNIIGYQIFTYTLINKIKT